MIFINDECNSDSERSENIIKHLEKKNIDRMENSFKIFKKISTT